MMNKIKGYEVSEKRKKDIIYVRMDEDMLSQLRNIRKVSGIPISEVIRESVRKTLIEVNATGSLNIKIAQD